MVAYGLEVGRVALKMSSYGLNVDIVGYGVTHLLPADVAWLRGFQTLGIPVV